MAGASWPGSMGGDPVVKRLLWHVLAGSRGGPNRIRILKALRELPMNTHQLAQALGFDYKTVQHHLGVLEESGLVLPSKPDAYGAVYLLSARLEENLDVFEDIVRRLNKG